MPFANVVCIFVARLLHDSKRFSSTMGCHLFVFSFCVCVFACSIVPLVTTSGINVVLCVLCVVMCQVATVQLCAPVCVCLSFCPGARLLGRVCFFVACLFVSDTVVQEK